MTNFSWIKVTYITIKTTYITVSQIKTAKYNTNKTQNLQVQVSIV